MDDKEINDSRAERAEEYRNNGRYAEAIALYRELVNEYPGQDSYLLALAWALLDAGRPDEAVDCFEALLERELKRDVFSGFAFDELVRIFRHRQDYARLVAVCEKAVSRYPDDRELLGELGHACLAAGDARRAVELFGEIVSLDSGDAAFRCYLGDALMAAGDVTEAEQEYRRAAEIDPEEAAQYYSRLGAGLQRLGAAERAEQAFRSAMECSSQDPLYRMNLGDCLVRRGMDEDAETLYEEAIAMNPAFAGAYYNRLGNAFIRAQRPFRAMACFRKAIAAEPANGCYRARLEEASVRAAEGDDTPE